MRVVDISDAVTHAVIGKTKTQDFGIANDAAMMNILSNSLYSDKKLAVVREVLCNAWDIHKQSGRTDIAVEITLTEDKLSIQDFGPGISDEDMHPIYAVYGASTKRNDGLATGGFGLGSKSPFAVVEHFEVISRHDGKKTIYRISKSSAEIDGKPGITPIMSIPMGAEESTGLTVSMNIPAMDTHTYQSLIEMIARFGEMNVKLNGVALSTIPFSSAKHGFLMLQAGMERIPGASGHKTFVRYGDVVYPIPDNPDIAAQKRQVCEVLNTIAGGSYHSEKGTWKIIFQAKPHSISVTPSRESLSMTDHTINTIKEIYADFIDLTANGLKALEEHCIVIAEELIEKVYETGRPVDLLDPTVRTPRIYDKTATYDFHAYGNPLKNPGIIGSMRGMAKAYMTERYPTFKGFREKDMDMRLRMLEKHEFGGKMNRGKLQSYRKNYQKFSKMRSGNAWFQQTLVQPLVRKLDAIEGLSGSKLNVFGKHRDTASTARRYGYSDNMFVEATKLSPRQMSGYMPFLRNIVVISFNRMDVSTRLPSFPSIKEEHGSADDFFVYVVSRTDKKIELVRKFFADQGMVVLDLTQRQSWEDEEILKPVPSKPKSEVKPRKKGLPKLSGLLTKDPHNRKKWDHSLAGPNNELERTETPQFIVKLNPRAGECSLYYGLDKEDELTIIRFYGDLGGIVVNDNQARRFMADLNIPALDTWLLGKLKDEVINNPRLQVMFECQRSKLAAGSLLNTKQRILFDTIVRSPELAIEFGILNEMTTDDLMLDSLIYNIALSGSYRFKNKTEVQEMMKHIKDAPVHGSLEDLFQKIIDSNLIENLNVDHFSEVFGANPTDDQKAQKSGALNLLLYALA